MSGLLCTFGGFGAFFQSGGFLFEAIAFLAQFSLLGGAPGKHLTVTP